MSENKITFPVKLASNNPQSFGIVDAMEVSGHRSVETLSELYAISDPVLSILKDGSDAIGQEWFVVSEDCKYRLDNWGNRRSVAGWTKLPKQEFVNTKQSISEKDQPNGYAGLDSNGKLPIEKIYGATATVVDVATYESLPATGLSGVIYYVSNTGAQYKWSGSSYIEITDGEDNAKKNETSIFDCSNGTSTKYYSSLSDAINVVPPAYRTSNRIISYLSTENSTTSAVNYQYYGIDSTTWTDLTKWKRIPNQTDLEEIRSDLNENTEELENNSKITNRIITDNLTPNSSYDSSILTRNGFISSIDGSFIGNQSYRTSEKIKVIEGSILEFSFTVSPAVLGVSCFDENDVLLSNLCIQGTSSLKKGIIIFDSEVDYILLCNNYETLSDFSAKIYLNPSVTSSDEQIFALKKSVDKKTLYSSSILTRNGFISSIDGSFIGNQSYKTSGKIYTNPSDLIEITFSASPAVLGISCFDKNDVLLSNSVIVGTSSIVTKKILFPKDGGYFYATNDSSADFSLSVYQNESSVDERLSVVASEISNDYLSFDALSLAGFIGLDGLRIGNQYYKLSPFLAVNTGDVFEVMSLASAAVSIIAGYADSNEQSFVTGSNIVGGGSITTNKYTVSGSVKYLRVCGSLDDTENFYLKKVHSLKDVVIDSSEKVDLVIKEYSNPLKPILSLSDFTQNTWTGTTTKTSVGNGIPNAMIYDVDFCEDIFEFKCKLKPTTEYFEIGIGKNSWIGAMSVTLKKDETNSTVRICNIEGNNLALIAEYILPFDLAQNKKYLLSVKKEVLQQQELTISVISEDCEDYAFKVYDLGAMSGSPLIICQTGVCECSDAHFSYPFSKNSEKILLFGDSYVHGDSLKNNKDKRYARLLAQHIGLNDVVIMGRGGESTTTVLERIYAQIDIYQAAKYAIIALGVNDFTFATYSQNMDSIISYLKGKGIIPILATIPTTLQHDILQVVPFNEYVVNSGELYFDEFAALCNTDGTWKAGLQLPDLIHPSISGHLEIFKRIKFDLAGIL